MAVVLTLFSCDTPSCLLKQRESNEYVSMTNDISGVPILDDGENRDRIYFEDIKYKYENNSYLYVLGNLMGGKSSLLIAIQKKPLKLLYSEESALCDSCNIQTLQGHKFLIVNSHYQDMCAEFYYYSIYRLDKGIYNCFSDYSRARYNEGELCLPAESYEQTFRLCTKSDSIAIFAEKVTDDGRSESNTYFLHKKEYVNNRGVTPVTPLD